MNLSYAFKLLAAADEQRHGFIKLRGTRADDEVRLMAEAGLVYATFSDGQPGSFTSINRLTKLGDQFLRTFRNRPMPAPPSLAPRTVTTDEWQADCAAAVLGKRKTNFAPVLPGLEQAAA